MSSKPAIKVSNLDKFYQLYAQPKDRLKQFLWCGRRQFYQEFWALKDINFEIKQGEVIGIIGRNGAGKSTLLQLICGTLTPSRGEAVINGRVAALLELGAGFNPDFTGRENIFMNASILGMPHADIASHFDEIVDFSGIREFIDQPVKTYSSGMYVRLAFSVAIHIDPDILVIDEALSVGDGAFARQSFDRIMKLKQAGKTILFCSHSMYQIEALCDRAIWLQKGQIKMIGSANEVTNKYSQSLIESTEPKAMVTSVNHTETSSMAEGTAQITAIKASIDGQKEQTELNLVSNKDSLRIIMSFDFDEKLPTPNIGLTFCTLDGLCISSASTFHDKVDLTDHLKYNHQIQLYFPKLPLLKGDYTISVYLACENAIHFYDAALDAIQLKVTQENTEQGFVSLPHQWN